MPDESGVHRSATYREHGEAIATLTERIKGLSRRVEQCEGAHAATAEEIGNVARMVSDVKLMVAQQPTPSPWRAILINGAGGALTAIIIGVLYLVFGRGGIPG